MKSVQGMFDLIQELRKETNHLFDRINPYEIVRIKGIYHRATTKREFKHELKNYLKW